MSTRESSEEMNTYRLMWVIDVVGETPTAAAQEVWEDVFGRSFASPDDACVFSVTDMETGTITEVDLSEVG